MSELRVWYLAATFWEGDDYDALVSEDERVRAGRFRFKEDAGRFLASRALVRTAVGSYLHVPRGELEFSRRCLACGDPDHGRPTVRLRDGSAPSVHYSLTRAGPVVAVAIGPGPLGLDAESPRSGIDELIDGPVFSPDDRVWIRAASGRDERQHRILTLWVGKEAVGKAAGVGLQGCDRVLIPPAAPGWRRATDADGQHCWLRGLHLPGTAAAAIATYALCGDLVVADARTLRLPAD